MGNETSYPKAVAFNSNIDFTEQIVILSSNLVLGYRSKCEGKTVSLYRNGELLADGVMNLTNADAPEIFPSLCGAELTYHDETFEAFSSDDTYTLALGDGEPISMAPVNDSTLFTQEIFDGLAPYILCVDSTWYSSRNGYSTFSIAQNVQTTKKKYDVKLLPEELLPKSVAKKSEVKSVERVTNEAYDTANDALNTANTAYNNAFTAQSTAESAKTTAESAKTTAESAKATAESAKTTAESAKATAESAQSTANGAKATAESAKTTAESAAPKTDPVFSGTFSQNRVVGSSIGGYSHAEGYHTIASGLYSHSEGSDTSANNMCSHAEGISTKASGDYSHAEGAFTEARGDSSHAEGVSTKASGNGSHAEGCVTIAHGIYQHVQGAYNIAEGDSTSHSNKSYLHIVGNGEMEEARSNAHTLDWSGNAWFAGDVYVGSTSGTDKDAGSKKLATENYIDSKITGKEIYLASSTPNSTKQFKITVDDTGTISATEVTA